MGPPLFIIDRSRDPDGAVRVIVRGVLDLASCEALRQALGELHAQRAHARLDLSGIEFMDSTGLGVIISARREAEGDGWSFELDPRVSEPARRLFNLAGVETLFWR